MGKRNGRSSRRAQKALILLYACLVDSGLRFPSFFEDLENMLPRRKRIGLSDLAVLAKYTKLLKK